MMWKLVVIITYALMEERVYASRTKTKGNGFTGEEKRKKNGVGVREGGWELAFIIRRCIEESVVIEG